MKKNKINMKSNSGFTMTDLIVALAIFTIFTGIIASLFYSSFKANMQVKLSSASISYAIQILEDIDKTTYDEVQNGMESSYISKFSIPSAFNLKIDVFNYNDGNDKEDLIKRIKLTITYEFSGETEAFAVERLKIKEL